MHACMGAKYSRRDAQKRVSSIIKSLGGKRGTNAERPNFLVVLQHIFIILLSPNNLEKSYNHWFRSDNLQFIHGFLIDNCV